VVAGKPKYVTTLGETDIMAGWRLNKAKGGLKPHSELQVSRHEPRFTHRE
jgi:hypothetical protein